MPGPKSTFQWPPNPLPDADLGPPPSPDYWKPQPASEPPAPAPLSAAQAFAPPREPTSAPAASRVQPPALSPLRHIESVFLGLARPTFRDRAADAHWQPDPSSSYCPRCAASTGPHQATPAGCQSCHDVKLPWDRSFRLSRYEGLIRDAIHELKFSAWRRLGFDLGRELAQQLVPLLSDIATDKPVLIPIPSTFRRRLSRGIDHTATLCRGIRQVTRIPIAPALTRTHRRPQVGLSQTDRRRNVVGTMKLRGHPRFEGCTLLVVDDVRTTGATMSEACKALRKGLRALGQTPAAIWSVTLALAEHSQEGPPTT